MPPFGVNQPGDTHFFTPMSVYNLGVVNCAHVYNDMTEPKDHIHCHEYHEGVTSERVNNVASLILKTLADIGIMREEEKGQNKNNIVLHLVLYLVELGYFKTENFVFLVVGLTKKSVDMLFNMPKTIYRKKDSHSMEELFQNLSHSKRVTVHQTQVGDFFNYDQFLEKIYRNYHLLYW